MRQARLQSACARGRRVAAERELCRTNLFYILTVALDRRDANNDWLFDRCQEVAAEPNGRLHLWAREHYKMLRLSEPIPTPSGWKPHGDLAPGDHVFGADGTPCRVVAISEVFSDGPAYEIEFDDGLKVKAGADHLWPVERRTRKRVPMAYNKPGVPKRLYRERVILTTREIAEHGADIDARLAIPVSAPLQLTTVPLPVDPYVLGAWLGDGTSASGDLSAATPRYSRR